MYWRIFTFQRYKDIAPFRYNIKAEQWRDADGSTNKQALCMHSLRALLSRGQGVVHANLLGLETTRLRRDNALHLGHRVHNPLRRPEVRAVADALEVPAEAGRRRLGHLLGGHEARAVEAGHHGVGGSRYSEHERREHGTAARQLVRAPH